MINLFKRRVPKKYVTLAEKVKKKKRIGRKNYLYFGFNFYSSNNNNGNCSYSFIVIVL